LASAFVGAGWDKIREYPLDRRPRSIAANIVFDCRRAVDRSLFRIVAHETPDEDLTGRLPCPRDAASWVQANALLESVVGNNVVSAEDAQLISLSRLHDVPVAELAPVYGIQPHSLRRRRLRAEAAIAAAMA
jgi:hypothetical protein